MNMTRREAVIKMALLMGASVVGPRLLAASFGSNAGTPPNFSAEHIALLDEIGEIIIPATDIPGAKAVGIGAFIAMMVTDCYTVKDQEVFKKGLEQFTQGYEEQFGEKFLGGKSANQKKFVEELDHDRRRKTAAAAVAAAAAQRDAETYKMGDDKNVPSPHYFHVIKDLTILGYFTSEVGSMQAMHYLEVPGRFDGDVPYKKGDLWYI